MTPSVLVSIHDVAPPHLDAVRRLRDAAASWGVKAVTLLAVPEHHGRFPLASCLHTVRWLREAAQAGDEVALHGYSHLEERPPRGAWARVRSRTFTAGEGECLTLDETLAAHRLVVGRRIIEEAVGRAVTGFVAPAWLEPPWYAGLLAGLGFGWHETAWTVERLAPPLRLRTPVIGFATRSPWREAAAVAWAHALAPLVEQVARVSGGVARVALHPGDAGSPVVLRCAERVIRRLADTLPSRTTAGALGLA